MKKTESTPKKTWTRVSKNEVFICKLGTVYGFAPSTITPGKVTTYKIASIENQDTNLTVYSIL